MHDWIGLDCGRLPRCWEGTVLALSRHSLTISIRRFALSSTLDLAPMMLTAPRNHKSRCVCNPNTSTPASFAGLCSMSLYQIFKHQLSVNNLATEYNTVTFH